MKKITILVAFFAILFSNAQTPEGTWKMIPQAGAMAVGDGQGNSNWWSNNLADVTTRACYFDDEFVFNGDGSFANVNGADTWVEVWQDGAGDGCRASVAPHDGSNAATWTYDSGAGTLTLNGVGAYLGLSKVYNGGELGDPVNAPASITYIVTSIDANTMVLDIAVGAPGWWRFTLEKQVEEPITPEGTWKMIPQAGAMAVGDGQGNSNWWSNNLADVTTRACYFDDEFVFNGDGSFANVNGADTWVEVWQDGAGDGCRASVAPHDGSNAATWTYDSGAGTLTLNGVGAYLGLSKVYNGGELGDPVNAPTSITYIVTSIDANTMVLDIAVGAPGWWRFTLQKQGVEPTCDDGIQNGDETGVDCGGSCPNECLAQIDLPIDFEGTTTDYTVTDFGGNASSLVVDPEDAGNMVIQTVKTNAAQLWAGTTISNDTGAFVATDGLASLIPFSATETKMNVRVWSPDAGIPVRLKAEDATNNTHTVETETLTTVAMGWEVIEFDFSNQAPGTETLTHGLNNGWVYSKVSIFFNFGTDGATAGEKTYYFDDVMFGEAPLSINDFEVNQVQVYPNPTQGNWNIKTKNNLESVVVFDILGKQVVAVELKNTLETTIDASSLPSGLYFAKVRTTQGESSIKLIKK